MHGDLNDWNGRTEATISERGDFRCTPSKTKKIKYIFGIIQAIRCRVRLMQDLQTEIEQNIGSISRGSLNGEAQCVYGCLCSVGGSGMEEVVGEYRMSTWSHGRWKVRESTDSHDESSGAGRTCYMMIKAKTLENSCYDMRTRVKGERYELSVEC
jgi:hypothetical protein